MHAADIRQSGPVREHHPGAHDHRGGRIPRVMSAPPIESLLQDFGSGYISAEIGFVRYLRVGINMVAVLAGLEDRWTPLWKFRFALGIWLAREELRQAGMALPHG